MYVIVVCSSMKSCSTAMKVYVCSHFEQQAMQVHHHHHPHQQQQQQQQGSVIKTLPLAST